MQPKIIKRDRLFITGLTGEASKTGEVWSNFDNQFNNAPFPKSDENGYEIRFWSKEKEGNDVHVGFSTETGQQIDSFTSLALPATEYAVFDVLVAKGYDSDNRGSSRFSVYSFP